MGGNEARQPLSGEVLDGAGLTLEELARACAVEPEWVVQRVRSGILLNDAADQPGAWRFGSVELVRARRLLRVESDFEAGDELAALVVDLCEEVRRLRAKLQSGAAR
ncbi:chaperone modulator CbpM [Pseudoduganella namucuonensis]|uniref:Chaperone modulatory protein CbpM n=1 Tax=Pseudoduganella namucuonensis TaxID=1035707 RepID=A0A1I7I5X3_9BURK|nr:chaperone modulator CbpM [Pseudoduganella namucuonensis]SFU68345.1 chaperone modulatory protein CbpM [Pseudoduganella namucuonensis]